MASLDRRAFLGRSFAAAVAGTPLFAWAKDGEAAKTSTPSSAPAPAGAALANEPWRLALERMKAENKPGVVFLVPKDPAAANQLANQLQPWLADGPAVLRQKFAPDLFLAVTRETLPRCQAVERPPVPRNPEVRQMLTQAVFACAPRRSGDAKDRPAGEVVVLLLDPAGNTVAEWPADQPVFGEGFHERLAAFLHGKRGERLAERARTQRAALDPQDAKQVDADIAALDSDEFAVRDEANARLKPLAPKILALLAESLRGEPSLEKRRRLEQLFDAVYQDETAKKPAALLPYGVRWQLRERDACPGCGLGSAPPTSRKFLAVLTQPSSTPRG
jgi:hypothetical protein